MHCFFGTGVQTIWNYTWSGPTFADQKPFSVGYGDGDGDQDAIDNHACLRWQGANSGAAFVAKGFLQVEHKDMVSNPSVMEALRSVLDGSHEYEGTLASDRSESTTAAIVV
eukprot:gnl/TRDRNA2_/TRDRNA2_171439_c0_seq5.p1 gnl/TRDRNA2_/TRDRNA2_171439_c0~~gnl/TRDRNA2_/TRDRNA2_171439_c0_seq5.p1  ORF type:complete len:111 (+),score=6.11 gnl/TRDRNA2_/TRDRNA2_171439_c0_seq5:214-546(+)